MSTMFLFTYLHAQSVSRLQEKMPYLEMEKNVTNTQI